MSGKITILGIDPGIHNTGLCVCKYDPRDQKLYVTDYWTLKAADLAKKENRQESKQFGNVFSLFLYEREFAKILETVKPDYVACEDAFYNPHMPNAFASLKLCIASIQRVLYTTQHRPLFCIPTRLAKKQTASTGDAGKVAIQTAIRQLSDLVIKDTKAKPIIKMVEHEADSIAIAYTFMKQMLPDLLHL